MKDLTDRLRNAVAHVGLDAVEKKMFGGTAFMIRGHMAVGVTNKGVLMIRVSQERQHELLKVDHVRPMDLTGRPMKGFLFVDDAGHNTEKKLVAWVNEAAAYNATQPVKKKKK